MPKIDYQYVCHIGVDPGKSGGIALIDPEGPVVYVYSMPDTERAVWDLIQELSVESVSYAAIEKVHSFPGQGVKSTFTFGQGYGFLRGCLTAAGIPFEEVRPQEWMRGLGIPQRSRTEAKKDYKNRLLQFAQQLYPSVEGITLATCDALLIATYCKRLHEGSLRG